MIITIQKKSDTVVTIPRLDPLQATAVISNELSLGQLKTVDISQAQEGDVLMLVGTKWQAESLDGGEFN
jgi:hypothetical protein